MAAKLVRGKVRIRAHYREAFANPLAPTAAELNNTDLGWEIGSAMADDYTMNAISSDTDDAMAVTDEAAVSIPTAKNHEVSFNIFRDEDINANGVFNRAFNLFKAAGCPFILSKGLGQPAGTPYAIGHRVSMYPVVTIFPEDILADTDNILFGARFLQDGEALIEYEVAA